jgi:hypothetical protein
MIAVQSGKALKVARIVLSSLFVELVLATVIMGFGLNATFSDLELRRYPVGAIERRVTRHLVALLDPFWFLGFALEIGLVIGLYGMGAGSFGVGLIAVLLLFVSNYLAARVFGVFVDRLMQSKIGALVLMAAIFAVALGAAQIPLVVKHSPAAVAGVIRVLRYTPPFGAAAAITGSGLRAASGIAVIVFWLAGLAAALVALERRPMHRQKLPTTKISFDSFYDRAGAWFGAEKAPLIAFWLRFYARNTRLRALFLLTLPLLGFLTYMLGKHRVQLGGMFVAALGTFALVGFIAPARFITNQFGCTGGGFRRYFLMPTDPTTALRTGSYASLTMGAPLIVVAAIAWAVLAPGPFDGRMLFMLVASGIAGLLMFHGLGLWTSVLAARRSNYYQNLGNDLSLAANIILIGGVLVCMVAPALLAKFAPAWVSPERWWIAIVPAVLALLFYLLSLRATGALFRQRHERLMAVVEGRN